MVPEEEIASDCLVSSVQSLSRVRFSTTPWTAARQASLSITNSWSPPKPMCIESVMPSSVIPFSSCLQSFLTSGSFPMSQLLASGGQSIGVAASKSVLRMNTQDWSVGWTGWISWQSKELSSLLQHHSSKASIQRSAFFMVQLIAIHDHWKNHSFDYMDLCWQSNVSAF